MQVSKARWGENPFFFRRWGSLDTREESERALTQKTRVARGVGGCLLADGEKEEHLLDDRPTARSASSRSRTYRV